MSQVFNKSSLKDDTDQRRRRKNHREECGRENKNRIRNQKWQKQREHQILEKTACD